MSSEQPQPEPSMEEILASIRRIISEDPAQAADMPAREEGGVLDSLPADKDDFQSVLDAVDQGAEDAPYVLDNPLPESKDTLPAEEEVFDLTPDMRAVSVLEAVPQDTYTPGTLDAAPEDALGGYEPDPVAAPAASDFTPPQSEPAMTDTSDRLMSPTTEQAAAAALAGLMAAGAPKIASSSGFEGVTVETIVRELLRPMLREWMDNNLPTLVERLVEGEIERLSRRRIGD